jgi:WD40 repeat protein
VTLSRSGRGVPAGTGRDLVFISYSHANPKWRDRLLVLLKPFVRQSQLQVWADPYIQAGQVWRREIDLALARSRVGVVLLTPDLLASDFIADVEIPHLLRAAAAGALRLLVVPVEHCAAGSTRFKDGDLLDYQWTWGAAESLDSLPRAERNAALVQVTNAIVSSTAEPSPGTGSMTRPATRAVAPVIAERAEPGPVYGVPPFPPNYIYRSDAHEALKSAILGPSAVVGVSAAVSTIGLHGQGGIGKTVVAMGVAVDEQVRRAFPDGVYWLTLGQHPRLESLQASLAAHFGDRPQVDDVAAGIRLLRERLQDAACLLVLDDVWQLVHAKAFDVLAARSRLVVTTRDSSLLTALGAQYLPVDALPAQAASELMARWAGLDPAALPPIARDVVEEVECLPLGLSLAGAQVRDGRSWSDLLAALRHGDLTFLDHPYGSILKSIQASVDALEPSDAARYLELAVFPEDAEVPEEIVEGLWSATSGLAPRHTRALLRRLASRNLLRLLPRESHATGVGDAGAADDGGRPQVVSMHDLQRDFVRLFIENPPALHARLVETFRSKVTGADRLNPADRWATLPDEPDYPWQFLAYHLARADRQQELEQLLTSADWLYGRLIRFSYVALTDDYADVLADAPLRAIRDAIVLSAHVLAKESAALMGQLAGRLQGHSDPRIQTLIASVPTPLRGRARLHPRLACLTPPGGPLLQTLEGHIDRVWAVTLLPDGQRALSASVDGTLKLWDLGAGAALQTLVGHDHAVTAVAVFADGQRAVSASADCTLKLWDIATGTVIQTFTAHTQWVRAVAVLSDQQRILSGSDDRTMRLWDVATGALMRTFTGHRGAVRAIVECGRERALSASADCTLKMWDLETGTVLATLDGHTDWLNAVTVDPHDEQALSAADDGTLRTWDLTSASPLQTMSTDGGGINAVTLLPDGLRALSGGDDNTVKLWDVAAGAVLRSFDGHADWVRAVAVLPDGRRALSGSDDRTLKLWDMTAPVERPVAAGHTDWLRTVTVLPDGQRALSGSFDGTLKLWDLATGKPTITLEGHSDGVTAVALLPDGRRALSGSDDGTVKLWDITSGTLLHTFEGHTGAVFAVAVLPDGRHALSASYDRTLKLWDLESRTMQKTLRGHTRAINAIAVLPGGQRVLSGSADRTVKLWNLATGTVLQTIDAHERRVWDVTLHPDGQRVFSAGDSTIKLWHLGTGALLRTFEGHTDRVWSVTVLPDGRSALSASDDHTLRLWSVERGTLLATFRGDAPYCCASAARSGAPVVAGDALGRLHILDAVI